MIRLAPAIRVPADLSIHDSIVRMNAASVGSVLVLGESGPDRGRLVGIFTERDVLRNFELLRSRELSEKPVRTLMTRQVVTLALADLPRAGAIMLERGIRHLPVVAARSGTGATELLGVISIRDVLRWNEQLLHGPNRKQADEREAGEGGRNRAEIRVYLDGGDGSLQGTFDRLIRLLAKWEVRVRLVSRDEVRRDGVDHVFIDLDSLPRKEWSLRIVASLHEHGTIPVTALFDPSGLEAEWLELLKKMDLQSKRFAAFARPFDVLGLLDRIIGTVAG